MASTLRFLMVITFLNILLALTFASADDESRLVRSTPLRPDALVLPVRKDGATSLHVATILKRTPQQPVPFVVDVNGKFLWVNCEQNYLSSTYNAPFCHSTQCARAGVHYCHKCSSGTPRPGCHNNTCAVIATNPVTRRNAISELAQDVLTIQSARNSTPGPVATVRHFLFACAPSSLLGPPLPRNVQGVAGLGHTPVALPLQFASHFGFPPLFAMCLTATRNNSGVIFFGNTTYRTRSGVDIQPVWYTPLTIGSQGEYFILVRSIRVNNKTVPFNTSLLSSTRGFAGTMISTTIPYTVLEHSIFNAFTQFFANQLSGVPQVKAVPPFGLCFNSNNISYTKAGPAVPNIDFVMQNRNVTWTFYSPSSMVQARPGATCLAFVDGGTNTRAPIVIGAQQLEEHLLQFDLTRSRLGFTSSLLFDRINCGDFNAIT